MGDAFVSYLVDREFKILTKMGLLPMTEEMKKAEAELNKKIGTPEFFGEPKLFEGLPVAGYKAQSGWAVSEVNKNKQLEELVLRRLDDLKTKTGSHDLVDGRWLAHGRTLLEDAFMAINRAIFKPDRVKLDPTE